MIISNIQIQFQININIIIVAYHLVLYEFMK